MTQSVLLGHGGDFSQLFRGLINYTQGNRRERVCRVLCLSCRFLLNPTPGQEVSGEQRFPAYTLNAQFLSQHNGAS